MKTSKRRLAIFLQTRTGIVLLNEIDVDISCDARIYLSKSFDEGRGTWTRLMWVTLRSTVFIVLSAPTPTTRHTDTLDILCVCDVTLEIDLLHAAVYTPARRPRTYNLSRTTASAAAANGGH